MQWNFYFETELNDIELEDLAQLWNGSGRALGFYTWLVKKIILRTHGLSVV